jgi:chemotaxis protein CheX
MLDQDIVSQAIRSATVEVFATMLGAEIDFDESAKSDPDSGMMALVGLTGSWSGAGTLLCSPALGNRASAAMFMSEPSSDPNAIDDEVLDAVAELTNMVVGNIKNTLEQHLGPMAISIPSVVYGRNFHFRSLTGKMIASAAFRWDAEPLEVKVVLAPTSDQEGANRLRSAVMALSH